MTQTIPPKPLIEAETKATQLKLSIAPTKRKVEIVKDVKVITKSNRQWQLLLSKRLRVIKLINDVLHNPTAANRDVCYITIKHIILSIEETLCSFRSGQTFKPWVYSMSLYKDIYLEPQAKQSMAEMANVVDIVELLSGRPVNGREDVYEQEIEQLRAAQKPDKVLGIKRLIAHIDFLRIDAIRQHSQQPTLTFADIAVSKVLLYKDLAKWKDTGEPPKWFIDVIHTLFTKDTSTLRQIDKVVRDQHHAMEIIAVCQLIAERCQADDAKDEYIAYSRKISQQGSET